MSVRTMNVSVGEELATYVEGQVCSGGYTNSSEVVREALREHRERRAARNRAIEQVDQDLAAGLEDLRQGRVVSAEESMRRAKAIIDRVSVD